MKVQDSQHLSALQMQDLYLNNIGRPAKSFTTGNSTEQANSFKDILARQMESREAGLKFSKHALGRLKDRDISLTDEQVARLSDGTQKAGAKGIKESLMLMDKLAFIVNIPSKTVVTAMEQGDADSGVFTNIDGAVIV